MWIDSLCIIQRGDGGEDLRKELAKMGSIYQNASLTVAIVASPDSSKGCFVKDKWPDRCFAILDESSESHLIGARMLDKRCHSRTGASALEIEKYYPLLNRAWVFQERLLSPRYLQCTYGEFVFECLQSTRCECGSGLPPHLPLRSLYEYCPSKQKLGVLAFQTSEHSPNFLGFAKDPWKTIVSAYMRIELSVPSDVMPAIAGCAQAMALRYRLNYVAGLWRETLLTDLMWYVRLQVMQSTSRRRPPDSTAPSWSWASVAIGQAIAHIGGQAEVNHLPSRCELLLEDAIREIHCEPESVTNPFGKLREAYLRIDAVLYLWYLRSFCTVAERQYRNRVRSTPEL